MDDTTRERLDLALNTPGAIIQDANSARMTIGDGSDWIQLADSPNELVEPICVYLPGENTRRPRHECPPELAEIWDYLIRGDRKSEA